MDEQPQRAPFNRDQGFAQLTSHLGRSKLPRLDGLRAISALLVIFYHFGVPYIPGGYGVMVFL